MAAGFRFWLGLRGSQLRGRRKCVSGSGGARRTCCQRLRLLCYAPASFGARDGASLLLAITDSSWMDITSLRRQ
jgi:hypothetical protein